MQTALIREALVVTRSLGGIAEADDVARQLPGDVDGPALWQAAHLHPAFEAADDGTGRIALAADLLPDPLDDLVVVAADVGSVSKDRFGWDVSDPRGALAGSFDPSRPSSLVEFVVGHLQAGRPVALGLECPLFIPVSEDELALGRARNGEGNRSWSAGAGTGAIATGLVQACWLLSAAFTRCPGVGLYLDWPAFACAGSGLLLWEAFVSAEAKGVEHVDDARIAVGAFLEALPDPRATQVITAERPLSLAATAAVWSGWSSDPALLREPPLLVRA